MCQNVKFFSCQNPKFHFYGVRLNMDDDGPDVKRQTVY